MEATTKEDKAKLRCVCAGLTLTIALYCSYSSIIVKSTEFRHQLQGSLEVQ